MHLFGRNRDHDYYFELPLKGSRTPNQLLGVLLDTMAMSGLSCVRKRWPVSWKAEYRELISTLSQGFHLIMKNLPIGRFGAMSGEEEHWAYLHNLLVRMAHRDLGIKRQGL